MLRKNEKAKLPGATLGCLYYSQNKNSSKIALVRIKEEISRVEYRKGRLNRQNLSFNGLFLGPINPMQLHLMLDSLVRNRTMLVIYHKTSLVEHRKKVACDVARRLCEDDVPSGK